MNRRSKILAGSSIIAFLAFGEVSLALGLGYSGELFALGTSTIGPILIAATTLFFGVSLILSISFLVSRHLEKKSSKEGAEEKQAANTIDELKKKVQQEEAEAESRVLEVKESTNKKIEQLKTECQEKVTKLSQNLKRRLERESVVITLEKALEQLGEEQERVRSFNSIQKKEYFKKAIKDFDKLAIRAMVNEKERFKCFSVYYAAKEGSKEVVKYIKNLGVDLNEPDLGSYYQHSPIYNALILNDTKALKNLLDNGADPIRAQYMDGRVIKDTVFTPLMKAVVELQKENVALLLDVAEVKDHIDDIYCEGETALMYSFYKESDNFSSKELQNQYDIVKLLLDKGANPTVQNDDERTALKIAREKNCNQGIISLLQKAEKEWKKKHKGKHAEKVAKGKGSQGPQK